MTEEQKKVLSIFSFRRMIVPALLGLGVISYLVWASFDPEAFKAVRWTSTSAWWLFCAFCLMAVRDIAYMVRLRILTDKQLSWKKSFQVIMLWEFASTVTPSVVGGAAVALFIVNKEGINMGRTTAIVLTTAFLDELFYVLMVPLILIFIGWQQLHITDASFPLFNTRFGTLGIFLVGYIVIILITFLLAYGIFINPHTFKRFLVRASNLPFLRRWKHKAESTGEQVITTSKELKGKRFGFWLKAFGATFFSWTARYWVVNCMMLAFMSVDDHFLVYARQLVMWVIMLITPTPGSSGMAEFAFSDFMGDLVLPGLGPAFALLWRLISYYPYLFIGIIVLPIWLRRVYKK